MVKRPILHTDLPTADRAATAHFYSTLFGWECGPACDSVEYATFSAGNMTGGFPSLLRGLRAVTEKMQAGDVVLYVPSDDLEAGLAQVTALGGTVVLPRTEAAAGMWVALFRDPNGALLALMSSEDRAPWEG